MKRWHLRIGWWALAAAVVALRVAGQIGEPVTLAALGALSAGHDGWEWAGGVS